MSDVLSTVIERLVKLEAEVARLKAQELNLPAGSASAPAVTLAGDSDTGIYRSAEDNLDIAAGGTNRLNISSDGLQYVNDLKPYRNSTAYTAHAFVPLTTPLTSTSWDGDAFSTTAATLIDLSAVFGVPAGVKAVLVNLGARDDAAHPTPDLWIAVGPSATYFYALTARPHGGNVIDEGVGAVPCNANGDIYYRIVASGAGTMDVWLRIWGYWL